MTCSTTTQHHRLDCINQSSWHHRRQQAASIQLQCTTITGRRLPMLIRIHLACRPCTTSAGIRQHSRGVRHKFPRTSSRTTHAASSQQRLPSIHMSTRRRQRMHCNRPTRMCQSHGCRCHHRLLINTGLMCTIHPLPPLYHHHRLLNLLSICLHPLGFTTRCLLQCTMLFTISRRHLVTSYCRRDHPVVVGGVLRTLTVAETLLSLQTTLI